MSATLTSKNGTTVTIQLQVELTDSMLNSEENILSSLNEAGSIATEEALKYFDTDGSKLIFGENIFSAKVSYQKNTKPPMVR